MYIRAKHCQNHTYYAVVRSERKDGKVRQRLVVYLGKHSTLESAISYQETCIEAMHRFIKQQQTRLNTPEKAAEATQQLRKHSDRLELLRALQRKMQRHTTTPGPGDTHP